MAKRRKTGGRQKGARKIAPVMGIKELLSKVFPVAEQKRY